MPTIFEVRPDKLSGAFSFAGVSVFLVGSIEMGVADEWQTRYINSLREMLGTEECDSPFPVQIFNPRRSDWKVGWSESVGYRGSSTNSAYQTIHQKLQEQIEWELRHIESADIVIVNLDSNTKSPITLLELGMLAKSDKPVAVRVDTGYYRYANVAVTCVRNDIPIFQTESGALNWLARKMEDVHLSKSGKKNCVSSPACCNKPPEVLD